VSRSSCGAEDSPFFSANFSVLTEISEGFIMRQPDLTIYYDASCPLCMSEMRNLMLRNHEGRVAFVDASPAGFVSPLPGCDRTELMRVIHGRTAEGHVLKGVAALRAVYEAVGLGWVLAPTTWPGLRQLADVAYPWVARHRHHVPRALVRWMFEGAARRAALRVASQDRCQNGQCRR
jgi:predicted DCC family thiol-disulfide oxidoreductase YuxK